MDLDRAALLLNICNLSRQWGTLKPIHDAAMAELVAMAAPKPQPLSRPTPMSRPSPIERRAPNGS